MDSKSFEKLLKSYAVYCKFQKGLSQKTLKAYQTDLKQFSCFVGDSNGFYTKEQIQKFLTYCHGKYKLKMLRRTLAVFGC